jgi:GntR family transcriptional regulator/MocR family aminotransferase
MKKELISQGKVGDKLPSIRKIASLYNLSKTTVESAFSQLYAEGYIESRPKSGYYVSDFYFEQFCEKEMIKRPKVQKLYRYDFFPARLRKEDFPLKLWKRLTNKVIDKSLDFGAYHDGQGEQGLREQIANYLIVSRGVQCEVEQVIITSGFSDAMGLLAKLVKQNYTHFGIENPGYHVARRIFEEYGYEIERIPVTMQGVDIESFKHAQAKILYITPSHQYPTGVTMPIANRLKLIEYIKSIDGLIIEDDYDSELAYYNRPIPALQGLDSSDSVVYLGTFAKSLSPALRIGYMVLPKHLLPLYHDSYNSHFSTVSLISQKTLEMFMAEGHWERHLRKIRTLNRKKHNLLKIALQKELKDTFEIVAEGAGLAILINPTVAFDWEKFKVKAEEKSMKLYFAKERCGGEFEAIRLGFGGFLLEEIVEAVAVFGEVWRESLVS